MRSPARELVRATILEAPAPGIETHARGRGGYFEEEHPVSDESDEKRLFREAVRDVKRLRTSARVTPPKPRPKARFARLDDLAVLKESLELSPGDLLAETGDELSFRRAGVQDAVLRKLRRGQYRVEAELDLHGLTVAQAKQELRAFLEAMLRSGARCVRIIHGKGLRSGHRGPVLKHTASLVLQKTGAVLAFSSARPVDGGTGAIYVLLSRR
ncbi:MAG TPA: Smr/MutS family protein [Steroidobacteraceae bacterium]|nr:Smr/MutS family protein [Steroidobacteraceae bacterium]